MCIQKFTLEYLLKIEEEYCNTHPQSCFCFETKEKYDPMDFVHAKPFSSHLKDITEGKGLPEETIQKYRITLLEQIIFRMMICRYSGYFRDGDCEVKRIMIATWEKLLKKMPQCTDTAVRRYLKSHDRIDFKKGDLWKCPFSLTCTTNEWPLNDNECLYEIHLLDNENTKAKNVYEIYNHGLECDNPEFQVNFPKNTSFRIIDIQDMINGGTKITMQEI